MGILAWVAFGLVVGIIANLLDPRPSSGGVISAIVLGILGALIGGYLGSLFFGVGVSGFNLSSMVVAVIGSLIVLAVGRSLSGRRI